MSREWSTVRLGQVLQHRKEFITIDDTATYKRPRVQLHAQGIVLRDEVPGALIKTKKQQVCRGGELLVAEIDAKVGGFGIVPIALNGAIVSSHYFLFGINDTKLERRFLDYFIRTPWFREQVEAQGSTNYAAIRPTHVLGYEIPLPPLAEQRRIVARVEELAAQINEARTLRHQATQETEALLTSTISAKLLSASESAANGLSPLESACELITDGAHNTPRYVEEGVPLLTAKNIFWDRIDTDNVRHISREEHEPIYRRCPVRRGDVLFINIGATTGTARKVDIDMEFSVKNVAMLRADPRQLDTDFLIYSLHGPAVRDQIAERQAQTCQQFLALRDIRNLKVPIPPIRDQRRVVTELDALRAELSPVNRLQAETASELDALLPAILDRAFKGEL